MVSRLGTMMTLAGVLLVVPVASAFTLGETAAATGVQGTLARSGATNAAGTIGTVKKAVGAAAATKQAQVEGRAVQVGWGGKGGGASGWAAAGGGWATNGQGGGWATATSTWATGGASGGSAWASGGWASAAGQ